jgi:glycolate oxidase FAD binding subunit
MNNLQPTTPAEVQATVKAENALLPVGGGSKSALSGATNGVTRLDRSSPTRLDMSRLSGIIEYEPGEYTFTAYAGTPVREVVAELSKHNQYLPFDPLLVKAGATLGGTVAANSGGSGRYRYGGVRDFIIGLHFVDGQGQLVRGGGKVVKNAAGFDLPKFMVGSMGRYGVFIDLSFKVFPAPRSYATLKAHYSTLEDVLQTLFKLAPTSFEIDALDVEPADNAFILLLRLGGLPEALPGRTQRLQNFLKTTIPATHFEVMAAEAESTLWEQITEAAWVAGGMSLVKVPVSPKGIPLLEAAIAPLDVAHRYSAGGNVAWLAVAEVDALDSTLTQLGLAGLVLLGAPGRPIIGLRKGLPLAQRVKNALDPAGKFLEP